MALRVALVSDWYLPRLGGLELFLNDLAIRLGDGGFIPEVLTPIPGPTELNGVIVHRLCDYAAPNGGYRFPPSPHAANFTDMLYLGDLFFGRHRPSALEQLKAHLTGGGYDVVHVHLGNTPFAYLAVNMCIKLGLPAVATFHSLLSGPERPLAWLAAKALGCANWSHHIELTAVSGVAAEMRSIMVGNAPFGILHNAIDTDWWRRAGRDAAAMGQRIELAAALRLHPRKRPMLLLDAMAKLKELNLPARLRIAGTGPLLGDITKRIERLGLGNSIELCGQLSREGLASLFAGSDLFLAPTRLESFGLAALEARAAGLPVLGMRQSGVRDFLKDGVDSLLADSDAAFVNDVARFASDATLRQTLAAGSQVPLSGYSWHDLIKACGESYNRAIALSAWVG